VEVGYDVFRHMEATTRIPRHPVRPLRRRTIATHAADS
jgi:hypothetical protein